MNAERSSSSFLNLPETMDWATRPSIVVSEGRTYVGQDFTD